MSYRLYVGNFPYHFSRRDVEHLFHNFAGIKFAKMLTKNKKCYSFFNCIDIDQLVSVIQKMNGAEVCGRKLKVQAADDRLQEYVNLLLQAVNDVDSDGQSSFDQLHGKKSDCAVKQHYEKVLSKEFENICHSPASSYSDHDKYSLNDTACSSEFNVQFSKDNSTRSSVCKVQGKQNECTDEQLYEKHTAEQMENGSWCLLSPSCSNTDKRSFTSYSNDINNQFSRTKSAQSSLSKIPRQNNKSSWKKQREKYSDEQFENISCSSKSGDNSFRSSSEFNNEFPTSNYAKNSVLRPDNSEFIWVSVLNFPLGTKQKSINELFSDYDPVDVKMICNSARKDRAVTEAHVCFLNQDIVDDVILNFDNTMFNGRLILVNDLEQISHMNDLLSMIHAKNIF